MDDNKYCGVVFDLDGTLLNTIDDLADSLNYALDLHGLRTYTPDEYRMFIGNGANALVRRAVGDDATREVFDDVYGAYNDRYARLRGNKTRPFDGVTELLEILNLRGIPIGVLSNKPHGHSVATVEMYFPNISFQTVIGAHDGLPIKPDPYGALEFAMSAGLPPGEVVFAGDTGVDMQTAVNAGMYPVGVTWGYRERGELLANGAKLLIDEPREILSLL
jgi:phosphoglycolate phosphatase